MKLTIGHLICFAAGAVMCVVALRESDVPKSPRPSPDAVDATVQSDVSEHDTPKENHLFAMSALQAGVDDGRLNKAMRAQPTARGADALQPAHATIDCCLSVAEDIDSVMAKRLRDQQSQNPRAFAQQLQANGQRLMELCALRRADESLYRVKLQEMRVESQVLRVGRELCKALQQSDPQVCANLEAELRSALQTQLVYEIKARGDFLVELREHVSDLTKDLDRMAGDFPQTVEKRLREMKACRDPNNPRWKQPEVVEGGIEVEPVIPPE